MSDKTIRTPKFKVLKTYNNNSEVIIIGMKEITFEDQLMILSYLRKKEYKLKIGFNVVSLEFYDEIYNFNLNHENIELPMNRFTIVFDFFDENEKLSNGVKTCIDIIQ